MWYAIRTMPGAQQPQREYAVEVTRSAKGYRIVPSLDPRRSAVEKALTDAGYAHYMPCELRVIRNRTKAATYTTRRFPLLPGYIFVHDVQDWPALEDVPGVSGYVSNEGRPFALSATHFLALRAIEARSETEAADKIHKLHSFEAAQARKTTAKAIAAAKRQIYPGVRVKALWGKHAGLEAFVEGWTADQQVKAILAHLDAAVVLPFDAVRRVA